eukprot:EG_transcript_18366
MSFFFILINLLSIFSAQTDKSVNTCKGYDKGPETWSVKQLKGCLKVASVTAPAKATKDELVALVLRHKLVPVTAPKAPPAAKVVQIKKAGKEKVEPKSNAKKADPALWSQSPVKSPSTAAPPPPPPPPPMVDPAFQPTTPASNPDLEAALQLNGTQWTISKLREQAIPLMKDVSVIQSFLGTLGAMAFGAVTLLAKYCKREQERADAAARAAPERADALRRVDAAVDAPGASVLPPAPAEVEAVAQGPLQAADAFGSPDVPQLTESEEVSDLDILFSERYHIPAAECARLRSAFQRYARGQLGTVHGPQLYDVFRDVGISLGEITVVGPSFGFIDVLVWAT